MVVRVPFSTNNRISRKLSVPLSHKNSYPRLLSSFPGRRLSFPRTSSGTVNELDEVSVIANDEADLNLSADGEHVALPQVQLSSALVHGCNIRDCNLDTLDGSVNGGTGEVARETDNIRGASLVNGVRLQHRATENRPNRTVIVTRIRQERIRTRAGVLGETDSALKLGCDQPVRKITVSDRNSLKRGGKVFDGVGCVNNLSVRVGQNVKVRTRRGPVDNSRVELAAKRRRQATGKLRVQGRQVTTELIRERLNDSQLVRSHALRTNSRIRNRLLVSLGNPVGLSVPGNHRDGQSTTGERNAPRSRHDDRFVDGVSPNLRRDFLREKVGNAARSAVKINTGHYWLLFLLKLGIEEVCELGPSVALNGFTRNVLKRRRTRSLILFTTELNKFIRSSLTFLRCRTSQKLRGHTLSGSNSRLQHRRLSSRQLRLKFLHPCRSLLNLGLLRFLNLVQLSGLSLKVCIIGETRTFPLDPLLNNPVKFFLRFRSLELGCLVLFSRVRGRVIFRHDNFLLRFTAPVGLDFVHA